MKKSLPTLRREQESLGRTTIMNAGLAARHGILYVHLVVFAIDVDRVREAVEDDETAESLWPFGFEVFLTEMHLAGLIDPANEAHADLLDDLIEDLLEGQHEEIPLGAQLAFAIHDAVVRGTLPESFGKPFHRWKKRPEELVSSLDELFERAEVEASDLAEACLEVELEPKLAPPTRDALEALVSTYETDREASLDEPTE